MTDEMRRRAFESYVNYLVVERGLSPNTVEAYRRTFWSSWLSWKTVKWS